MHINYSLHGCFSTENGLNLVGNIEILQYSGSNPFVWSQSINSRKAGFSGIATVETHNKRYNHLLRWLSVQEFPDMIEAEFYLGQGVQSICVCVCSVETKAAF